MSRTIADLTAGTKIYIDETVSGETTHVPYIYLGIDDYGKARVLRQYAVQAKRMHSSNVAAYAGCEMDTWLENTFISRFDAATQNALVNTTIKYVDYTQSVGGTAQVLEIARRIFLLSYSEEGYGNDAAGNEGSSFLAALQTFTGKTGNAARIVYNASNTAVSAWLRSAYSATNFRFVYASGTANNYNASYTNIWPRPALSVAPATIVSDEGADEIFLLPDGRRTTWDISMEMELGESESRPKQAHVELAKTGISSATVKVCNNFGDAAPVWATCDANGDCDLNNSTKTTTNWKIGIKIEATANSPTGYIGEPAVIVATD